QIAGHTWKRSIAVERLTAVTESAWCSELPGDARSVRRSREVREERKVPDGEDCQTRKVDRGDGTFVERQECTPRYRTEPIYADRCTFTVDRWRVGRRAEASGAALSDAPRWPDPAPRGGERVGAREETYTVKLRGAKGEEHECELPEARWAALTPGASVEAKIRVVTGSVDCSSLR
ncbi:MAG: hypothetical protein FJ104_10625, partial [Deltaproteobacteria bacterium]|nr:hypothetical protein [Deltaproteobacteria bacterium]